MPVSPAPVSQPLPDEAGLRRDLSAWFTRHARELPWRELAPGGQRDPYRVWVAEVLLQQTQVARGRVYFGRFLTAFPSVQALAAAPLEAVLKAWEGCGYYARARNLHRAAGVMAESGIPTTHAGWLALPGVGAYTAAAVSSLAFGEQRAVLDGNVRRVLSRLHAVEHPDDRWAQAAADRLLDRAAPGRWNEALMDLGATVCTPKSPRCGECPVSPHCRALASGEPGRFPAPKKRAAVKLVRAAALIVGDAGRVYLERRGDERGGGLLGGLWGLPLEPQAEGEGPEAALARLQARLGSRGVELMEPARRLGEVAHTMTHRQLDVTVYRLDRAPAALPLTDPATLPLSRLDHKALALLQSGQPGLFG